MSALGASTVSHRLAGALEIDELAVHAEHQGISIARRLIQTIAHRGEGSWLPTAPSATGAIAFYRRPG